LESGDRRKKDLTSVLTKEGRKIFSRRIGQFWQEFKTKKIGITGIVLLSLHIIAALFAPWLTPYDPLAKARLAQPFAMPEWVTIFPQFKDLTKSSEIIVYWNKEQESKFIESYGEIVQVKYKAETLETVHIRLNYSFSYMKIPPEDFYLTFRWKTTKLRDTEYYFVLTLFTPENPQGFKLWIQQWIKIPKGEHVQIESVGPWLRKRLGLEIHENLAKVIFSQKGKYMLRFEMWFKPLSENAEAQVLLADAKLTLLGHVHGILGTDNVGADIFSQLIYGARISLLIGLLAAIVATTIGILVGIVSGYLGGSVDEVTMRIVDILICLPVLPLLLALVFIYGKNIFYIIVLIAIFGWQGLSRVVRSQTLSIREMPYIDSARASGASGFYIMLKHILPNIIPVAFASLVLAVPGAILLEAALSFLGFGDPRVPSWGKMLHHAYGFGGFTRLAWWWIIPPGTAIISLCLAFVFIGHAFDEIVNPRLRRRR
jgi:peptide/nickel transport system permease protein